MLLSFSTDPVLLLCFLTWCQHRDTAFVCRSVITSPSFHGDASACFSASGLEYSKTVWSSCRWYENGNSNVSGKRFVFFFLIYIYIYIYIYICKGKAVPLQAWSGPEGSRKLRFPNYMTTQDGGKVVIPMHRPP